MKLPKITKLPSGNYRMQLQVDGVRHSITDSDPKTVKQKAKELIAGIEREKRLPLTVGMAIDKYIQSKDAILSPATILGYKRCRKNCLQSIIDVNITSLTREEVQRAVNKDSKKGLSSKTIRNAHGLLSAVLKEYRPGFVLTTTLPQKSPHNISILTEEELVKVLACLEGTKYHLPVLMAAWLGLRMSEVLGLRFEDISNGRIHIQRAKVMGEKAFCSVRSPLFRGAK